MGFFDSISSGFSSAWDSIKNFGSQAVNNISSAASLVFNWSKENIPAAVNKVVD
jgi:hypothetical protein